MTIDSKHRDFTYLTYKHNYPLQLKGTMKHKQRSELKTQVTSTPDISFSHNISISQKFTQQIVRNYQDLKSCLPYDLSSFNQKIQSKRINHHHQKLSGIQYLMVRSTNHTIHPQKKHLSQKIAGQTTQQSAYKTGKKYQNKTNKQSIPSQPVHPQKKLSTATYKKLSNDIYSNVDKKQNINPSTKKLNKKANMFIEGIKLGYQLQKQKKISQAKMLEIVGSISQDNVDQHTPRHFRTVNSHWNKSTFAFY